MKLKLTLTLAVVVAAVGLAGCGEDNKVGDESLLNFQEQAQERLGQTTTTLAPETTTTTAGAQGAPQTGSGPNNPQATATTAPTRPSATPAPTATTQTTAAKPNLATLEIFINDDNAAAPIDPPYARVFVNSIVRWINNDSVPRSVQAVSGQFRSPAIPPGGSYDYKATTVGIFDYGDGTRPYVNATLEVLEG